jgi:hypothetical protein
MGQRDEDGKAIPASGEPISPTEGILDEPDDDEELDDETDADEADDADEDEEETDEPDEGGDEEGEVEDEDEAEEEYAGGDYHEDDEFEIPVDGETRVVTLRELFNSYSGEGAIDKRLKEATELRKAAKAEHDKATVQIEEYRTNLLQTVQQLENVLFAPMVAKPDRKLRAAGKVNEYLMQEDAYEEDQKRINTAKENFAKYFTQQTQAQAANKTRYRQEQQQLLVEKMPEIKDPEKGSKIKTDILAAAAHYGFSEQDVAQVENAGLFLMARDAARWLNMQKIKQSGGKPIPSKGDKERPRRRLRSGTVASKKVALVKSNREQKAATEKAKSGRIDDVASMLVAKARTVKGTPNGRSR